MLSNLFLVIVIVFLLLIIFNMNEYLESSPATNSGPAILSASVANAPVAVVTVPPVTSVVIKDTRSFYQMTDGEKIDFIINNYGLDPDELANKLDSDNPVGSGLSSQQTAYVASLPVSNTGCVDNFDGCTSWAAAGECNINPEFMLYECPAACSACALAPQDKYNLVELYNKKPPSKCAYRNALYPDRLKYLRGSEKYFDTVAVPI